MIRMYHHLHVLLKFKFKYFWHNCILSLSLLYIHSNTVLFCFYSNIVMVNPLKCLKPLDTQGQWFFSGFFFFPEVRYSKVTNKFAWFDEFKEINMSSSGFNKKFHSPRKCICGLLRLAVHILWLLCTFGVNLYLNSIFSFEILLFYRVRKG